MNPVQEEILEMLGTVDLVQSGIIAAAIITAMHYLFKGGAPKPVNWHLEVRRYLWGVLAIGIPFVLQAAKYGEWRVLALFVTLAGIATGTSATLYLLDRDQLARQRGEELRERGVADGKAD